MRLSSFSVLTALLLIATAKSFLACSLNLPRQLCIKTPATEAKISLSLRGLPKQPLIWRTPNTQTSIEITLIRQIPGRVVINVLNDIYQYVSEHVSLYHDSVIAGGYFEWKGPQNLMLQVVNGNNHQTTWGVLSSAVEGLKDFMLTWPSGPTRPNEQVVAGYAVYFNIMDGGNIVGMGTFG